MPPTQAIRTCRSSETASGEPGAAAVAARHRQRALQARCGHRRCCRQACGRGGATMVERRRGVGGTARERTARPHPARRPGPHRAAREFAPPPRHDAQRQAHRVGRLRPLPSGGCALTPKNAAHRPRNATARRRAVVTHATSGGGAECGAPRTRRRGPTPRTWHHAAS